MSIKDRIDEMYQVHKSLENLLEAIERAWSADVAQIIQRHIDDDSALYIKFRNHHGDLVTDKVRAATNVHHMVEPYGHNYYKPSLILTDYRWIPLSAVVEWCDAEDPIPVARA
jgi:hypothetical protein